MLPHFKQPIAHRLYITKVPEHGLTQANAQALPGHSVFQPSKPSIEFSKCFQRVYEQSVTK